MCGQIEPPCDLIVAELGEAMTTKQEISSWFDRGVAQGARHMLVICDSFDHEDYPVFTETDEECFARYKSPGEMQRVMEVYDLTAPKAEQMNERRALRLPTPQSIVSEQERMK